MFRPVRMALVHIYALRRALPRVTTTLMTEGVLHIENAEQFVKKLPRIRTAGATEKLSEIDGLLVRLEELARRLGVPWVSGRTTTSCPHLDPENIADEASKKIGEITDRVDSHIREMEEGEIAIENLELLSTQLQSLAELGVSDKMLNEPVFISFETGTVPAANLTSLRNSIESLPVHLEVSRRVGKDVLVNVVTTKPHAEAVSGALRGAHFSRMRIPTRYTHSTNAVEEIEVDLWERREDLSALRSQMENLREELREEVWLWKRTLEANRRVLASMDKFIQTDYAYYITGWVPMNQVEPLRRELCSGRDCGTEMDYEVAEEVLSKHEVEVPTKLRHPFWMRPFKQLVNVYGWPRYEGLDPTPFLMLTFVPMFGIMFGDVGHGLVLMAAGAALLAFRKQVERLAEFGGVLLWCGLSAIAFGFLFGSVFGAERVLPRVWRRPLESPEQFLKVGVLIGIGCISLGLILNIIQSVKRKDWYETFFGQWGFLSIVFYWTALGLIWGSLRAEGPVIGAGVVAILILWPLAAMTIGARLTARFAKRKPHEEEGAAEIIFRPIELLLYLLTHTVSFVRVGAFSLSHAALLSAVYIASEALGGFHFIVEGNIGVILLEGLIVFIQCMRLEFYEFFSKFFLDQGKRYEPLCLPR